MERSYFDTKFIKEQFNTYWPRVQRSMKPVVERIQTVAREYLNSKSPGIKRKPHKTHKAHKAKRSHARRTRTAHA